MSRSRQKPYLIGIDPAARKNGFTICVCDEESIVRFITFKKFYHFSEWLRNDAPEGTTIVGIENSNLQKTVFGKYFKGKKMNIHQKLSVAMKVGKNQDVSQNAVDFCVGKYGKEWVYEISPKDKGKKIVSEAYFAAVVRANKHTLMDYKGTQDERDAYAVMSIAYHRAKSPYSQTKKKTA